MVLPGHVSGGYLVTRAILYLAPVATSFSSTQTIALYIIGIIASEGPDFDLIAFFFEQKSKKEHKKESHRTYLSHVPLVWLIGSLIIVLIGYIAGSPFISLIGWVILGGSWSHLILDSVEYGIRWLWPISNKFYCIHHVPEKEIAGPKGTLGHYWKFVTQHYMRYWTFYLEIAVTIVALLVFLHTL